MFIDISNVNGFGDKATGRRSADSACLPTWGHFIRTFICLNIVWSTDTWRSFGYLQQIITDRSWTWWFPECQDLGLADCDISCSPNELFRQKLSPSEISCHMFTGATHPNCPRQSFQHPSSPQQYTQPAQHFDPSNEVYSPWVFIIPSIITIKS